MHSFYTIAGVLAAVVPAMAVPQQYTGFYPMPNATHPTGPIGTGFTPSLPSQEPTSTTRTTTTRTSTTTRTTYLTVTGSSGSGSSGSGGSEIVSATTVLGQETACGAETVTITTKERETITVTAQPEEVPTTATTKYGHTHFHHIRPSHLPSGPSSSLTKTYGFPNGTTPSFPIGTGTGYTPSWTRPTSSPTLSSSTPESTFSTPTPTPTPTPSSTSSTLTMPTSASSTFTPSSTTSTTATPTYTPSPSTGKRGVSYNDASLANVFESSSEVSWAYNWGSSDDGLASSFSYVPMLWGNTADFTDSWSSNVEKAIAAGSKEVFAFNEPDLDTQSNMDPATAADAFKTYLSPLSGKVRIGSPSVTNGAAPMGIDWLTNFMTECDDCPIDFVTIHWYDSASNAQYFKDHVTEAHEKTGKTVWVTEFGASGSDDEINAFLEDVMPWLDQQDFVEKYAYFMASDGLLCTGTEPSTYGATYAGESA